MKKSKCCCPAQHQVGTSCLNSVKLRLSIVKAIRKISGIKRHLAVDTNGFPHAIYVTTANISDKAGAVKMFEKARTFLPRVKNILCDGGYKGQPFADKIRNILGCPVEVVKRLR